MDQDTANSRSTATRPVSRRSAVAMLAGAALSPASAASRAKAAPRPRDHAYEVVEVGPGKRFPSLTLAGAFINGIPRWNNGAAAPEQIQRQGFRIIVSPGPPGYYTNDSGSHSRRWPELVGWPPYEGNLYGPVVIEGEAGNPRPVLGTDGYGDGVLYYQKGLFCTGNFDATFRRLVFQGFRRRDGNGNYAAIRLGDTFLPGPMKSRILIEDCEFTRCDNGVMGGAPGQSLTIRRSHFHHNGNDTGRVHNIYAGALDELRVEEVLSSNCAIGHLLKTRAARTIIRNSRLLGAGGSESACLDVPNAGVLDIDGLVCEKSADSDAGWIIHYSGEHDAFHQTSSVRIRNLVMLAPRQLRRHPGQIVGFANQSGLGVANSGKGSRLISVDAQNVAVFGLTPAAAGLPCRVLSARPAVDARPPQIA